MLSGRSKKEYAKESQAATDGENSGASAIATNGVADESLEAVVAM